MADTNKRLDRLDELLFALPQQNFPMSLSALDGYVTGVLCCSEMIAPSEWLNRIWGDTGDAEFPDLSTAQTTIGAVMEHYNDVASAMSKSTCIEPIYEVDANSDETMWERWIDGFSSAVALRPRAWEQVLQSDDKAASEAFAFLMALSDIYHGESDLAEDALAEIDAEAPDLIPNCISTILHLTRPELFLPRAANSPNQPFAAKTRIGRNDPCSCGSGRQYKVCCGKN